MIAAMPLLVLGLVLFLGIHLVRVVADDWRARLVARRGPTAWRTLHSVLAAPRRGRAAIPVVVGVLAWMLFAFHLHRPLIGVMPISWH
jgi:uncharacterized membrane protein